LLRTWPFSNHGNGVFQSTRKFSALATVSGAQDCPPGTRLANLVIWRNGAIYKDFRGMTVAEINADVWRQGGAFT